MKQPGNVGETTRKIANSVLAILIALMPSAVQSQNSLEQWFDQKTGIENSGIINGPEYRIERLGASTTPFFGNGETNGKIVYQNQTYHVPLLYDIYKDEVVVKHLSSSGRGWFIQLDKNKVAEFELSGRLFRKFDRGFHEVIYEDTDFQVVSRRSKLSSVKNAVHNYVQNDRTYIVEENRWNLLNNSSGFMRMLPDKEDKKKLKTFIKENKIKVRRLRNEDLVKVAAFVNVLRHKHPQ